MTSLKKRKIAGYLLSISGSLMVAIFMQGMGSDFPPAFWLFLLIGLPLFAIGLFLLNTMAGAKILAERKKQLNLYHDLELTGERITVDLNKCEVKENSYTEDVERYASYSAFAGAEVDDITDLAFGPTKETVRTNVIQSVIIYNHEYNGKTERFVSPVIAKDKTTLLFKLYAQKQTTLYVHNENRNIYCFDLQFLDQ